MDLLAIVGKQLARKTMRGALLAQLRRHNSPKPLCHVPRVKRLPMWLVLRELGVTKV